MVKLKYHGSTVRRATSDRIKGAMRSTARTIKAEIKEKVSIDYPPASSPGRYPHRRSGDFERSISYRTNAEGRTIYFFSDVYYAVYLEFGTRKMKPRPTFRLAMREFQDRIHAIFRKRGSFTIE